MTLYLPRHVVEELNAPPEPPPRTTCGTVQLTHGDRMETFCYHTTCLLNVARCINAIADSEGDAALLKVELDGTDWPIVYKVHYVSDEKLSFEEYC